MACASAGVRRMAVKSKLDLISDDDFVRFVLNANTISEITEMVGYAPSRKSDGIISKRIKSMGLSTAHFKNWNSVSKIPTEQLLVINSEANNQTIKKRVVSESLLSYECAICANKGEWQNKPIVLHLDHINGNNKDNRLINLRLLCPNCHSQTDTYGGRNINKCKSGPSW